jgi:hypothetical protein
VIGTVDKAKKFNAIALCISKDDYEFVFQSLRESVLEHHGFEINPKILVADGAEAIHNGFKAVFNMEKRIMCWAHLKRKFVERSQRVEKLSDDIFGKISQDIDR